ncbi:hypothetical protein CW304_16965 [Bacillus sp. UFRGS-B20]|nr:hypothetical protein CW304_16965 [Bacillus sp. UFRGS-B20]
MNQFSCSLLQKFPCIAFLDATLAVRNPCNLLCILAVTIYNSLQISVREDRMNKNGRQSVNNNHTGFQPSMPWQFQKKLSAKFHRIIASFRVSIIMFHVTRLYLQ